MMVGDQVAVPAQHGLGPHRQPDPVKHVAGESVQQGGQERAVRRDEAALLTLQVPFQDHDLVPEREDLRVLGPIAHGKQSQHRQRVGHAEIGQSKKHSTASSLVVGGEREQARDSDRHKISSGTSNGPDQGGRSFRHAQRHPLQRSLATGSPATTAGRGHSPATDQRPSPGRGFADEESLMDSSTSTPRLHRLNQVYEQYTAALSLGRRESARNPACR